MDQAITIKHNKIWSAVFLLFGLVLLYVAIRMIVESMEPSVPYLVGGLFMVYATFSSNKNVRWLAKLAAILFIAGFLALIGMAAAL